MAESSNETSKGGRPPSEVLHWGKPVEARGADPAPAADAAASGADGEPSAAEAALAALIAEETADLHPAPPPRQEDEAPAEGDTEARTRPTMPEPPPPPSRTTAKRRVKGNRATLTERAREHGGAMAKAVVASFVGSLTSRAEQRGGYLTVHDIEAMSDEFERQAEMLRDVFAEGLESFARNVGQQPRRHARGSAFHRLIVREFQHLLADGDALREDPDAVSRRMLPGFFLAVSMTVGSDSLIGFERRAEEIVDRLERQHGDAFTWDHAYADDEARDLVIDALVFMAQYFDRFDKRADWMLSVVNSHLTPVEAGHPAADWTLTETGVRRVLKALFARLTRLLHDDLGRLRITRRHGAETVIRLSDIVAQFE